ncbi:MAG: DNA repair protein RecN [Chromatiaceae bacterium]|nr:DNA repair protein RecN [Chromatiaceae bacterium]MCP5439561.1 DNA repair protein RecN [Chromatiaceae bacterium]
MLSRITIRNLVIVRSLDLDLRRGMTALTGETGAGKSILIDALGLALGEKADSGMIRAGADQAEISVGFDLEDDSPALDWLAQHDLAADGECLLRRVLVRNGRNRAYINGIPTPQALLRELGDRLVDIHGQHAHQSLLHAAAQRQLLDAYAGLRAEVRELAQLYQSWRSTLDQLASLRQAGDDRASRLDYLSYQIRELEDVAIDCDDLADLEAEQARLAHAERLLGDSATVLAALDDDEPSIRSSLDHAGGVLTTLAELDPSLVEARDLLETAGIQIEEAVGVLRRYQDRVELDPERLQQVDAQLGGLHDAARKHRVDPDQLMDLLQRLRDEAQALANADHDLIRLQHAVDETEKAYLNAAARLSTARRKAAEALSGTVTASMQTLGMRGGRLRVACEADNQRPGPSGIDRVTFLVAANPGQPEAPLSDVASGGELSRISLAIQVATANCGSVPTLIFDEVDVGIGGAVAEIVGQLLRRLARDRQVLCVTHLPQVASQAHHQLRVHKMTDGKTTETGIDCLDEDARVDEVARMLGGVDITEQTRRHAQEMIERAQGAA